MKLSLIVAMTADRVIGREGELPWRMSSDLKRFKRLTMGHHLIMGRTTYQSIGRPLPGRTSLILSRNADFQVDAQDDKAAAVHRQSEPLVEVMPSLEQAMQFAAEAGDQEAFVIGGGQIYQLALPHVDRMYVTQVEASLRGDAFFPEWDPTDWDMVTEEQVPVDEKNEYRSVYRVYDRRS